MDCLHEFCLLCLRFCLAFPCPQRSRDLAPLTGSMHGDQIASPRLHAKMMHPGHPFTGHSHSARVLFLFLLLPFALKPLPFFSLREDTPPPHRVHAGPSNYPIRATFEAWEELLNPNLAVLQSVMGVNKHTPCQLHASPRMTRLMIILLPHFV